MDKLTLLGPMIIGLACLSSVSGADASASKGPTLEGAQVAPENGPWGSIFTYEVIYTDNENNMPAAGYPKIYIDGSPENMVGKDPTDNDVTDGKVYKYDWATAKENVGIHSFYCYVETTTGENARDPATGIYEGPRVIKQYVFLSCEVDNPEPATGESVTFSGYLRTIEENRGVAGEGLILYKLLLDDNVSENTTTTRENGYFTLSLDVLSPGIFVYKARFLGDNYYEASESPHLYVNTLDKPLVFGVYAVILLAVVGVMMFLFSRGIARSHYLEPVLLGFGLGFFLMFILAGVGIVVGFLGFLAAGGIAGYLFARETPKWTKHLRIGCMTGFLFLLVVGLISVAYFLTWSPDVLRLKYSVTQMEVFGILLSDIIFSSVNFSLLVGIGAVLGGMLRKLLKPAEQKPIGSGELPAAG